MAVILGMTACNDHEEKVIKDGFDFSEIQRPPVYDGSDKNYCKGCGTSYVDSHYCDDEGCVTGVCNENEVTRVSIENQLPYLIDNQECYDIRDDFLIKTAKGQDYITYYYRLSSIGAIDASNVGDYFAFATDIINVVDLIQNGADSDIPVTTSLKNSAVDIINDHRALTSDPELVGYLDAIEADLVQYENKTVLEIITDLNN